MSKRLVVVSPHPDDETLGAGGTIIKYRHLGAEVFWLNFTDMHEEYGYSEKQVADRTQQINQVCEFYKFNGFYNLNLCPAGLSQYDEKDIIRKVGDIFREIQPNIIILPFGNDVHSDHRRVFDIVYSCTKVFRYPSIKRIMAMEVLSETEFANSQYGFVPNYFVNITEFLEDKIKAISFYQGELGEHPFPRSSETIRALATFRGAAAGCKYAEGFIMIKGIE